MLVEVDGRVEGSDIILTEFQIEPEGLRVEISEVELQSLPSKRVACLQSELDGLGAERESSSTAFRRGGPQRSTTVNSHSDTSSYVLSSSSAASCTTPILSKCKAQSNSDKDMGKLVKGAVSRPPPVAAPSILPISTGTIRRTVCLDNYSSGMSDSLVSGIDSYSNSRCHGRSSSSAKLDGPLPNRSSPIENKVYFAADLLDIENPCMVGTYSDMTFFGGSGESKVSDMEITMQEMELRQRRFRQQHQG